MITKEEFEKTYIRIMDSLRDNAFKGRKNCEGVACDECPLKPFCHAYGSSKHYRAFDVIEIVEKWGAEHPVITRADKYKEVFGTYPKYKNNDLFCPGEARIKDNCLALNCDACKNQYWNEEYVEPKKEN